MLQIKYIHIIIMPCSQDEQEEIAAAKKAVEDSKRAFARVSECQKSTELLREEAIAKQLSEKRKENMVKGLSDNYSGCRKELESLEDINDCIRQINWIVTTWGNYNKKKTVSENYKINEIKIEEETVTLDSLNEKRQSLNEKLLTLKYDAAKKKWNEADTYDSKTTAIQELWNVHDEWEVYNGEKHITKIKDISLVALREEIIQLEATLKATLGGGSKTKKRKKTKKQKKKKKHKKTKR